MLQKNITFGQGNDSAKSTQQEQIQGSFLTSEESKMQI